MVGTTISHDKILLPIVTLVFACGLPLCSASSGPEASSLTPSPQAVQESQYEGEPVSLKVVGISLVDFLRTLSELSGLNFLIDPEVTGSLTLNVEQVPWDQLLDSVLQSQGLVRSIEGALVRISTQTKLIQERQIEGQLREAKVQAAQTITVSRRLNYATATEILPNLESQLSPRGSINVDIRTNTVIITDIPSAIERLLGTTDSR